MASNGIITNDKTGAVCALIQGNEDFEFVDENGKRYVSGLGCPGGWTMAQYKEIDITKLPSAVKTEIEKVPPENIYGSIADSLIGTD